MTDQQPALRRSLGLWLLTAYGVGVTIGAGIYVLIGAVASTAGGYAPLAFLTAGGVALFTALSFAELSVRYPVAAGEAAFVDAAFGSKTLSSLVGLGVICTGIVSSGTIALGAAGYMYALTGLPHSLSVIFLLVLLGSIAAVGIRESVSLAAFHHVHRSRRAASCMRSCTLSAAAPCHSGPNCGAWSHGRNERDYWRRSARLFRVYWL